MSPRGSWTQAVAAVVLPLFVLQCTMWKVAEVEPRQWFAGDSVARARITARDGQVVDLSHPRVIGDSVVGSLLREDDWTIVATSIAISDVTRIERRGFNAAGTVGLVVFIVGGLFLAAAAAVGAGLANAE